jgi:hypothetical protein
MGKVFRILSIDGGGIRGVIPAAVLGEIENRTGQRIADLFDLISGTSTGGILALGGPLADARGSVMCSAGRECVRAGFSDVAARNRDRKGADGGCGARMRAVLPLRPGEACRARYSERWW